MASNKAFAVVLMAMFIVLALAETGYAGEKNKDGGEKKTGVKNCVPKDAPVAAPKAAPCPKRGPNSRPKIIPVAATPKVAPIHAPKAASTGALVAAPKASPQSPRAIKKKTPNPISLTASKPPKESPKWAKTHHLHPKKHHGKHAPTVAQPPKVAPTNAPKVGARKAAGPKNSKVVTPKAAPHLKKNQGVKPSKDANTPKEGKPTAQFPVKRATKIMEKKNGDGHNKAKFQAKQKAGQAAQKPKA